MLSASEVVPAMWQAVGKASTDVEGLEFDPLYFANFEEPGASCPFKITQDFSISYRGQLGSKLPFYDVINRLEDDGFAGIGSVSFKCSYTHEKISSNISVIVFNTGKIKLSGGFPKSISRNDSSFNLWLSKMFNIKLFLKIES